jgi:hypothetical protein
LADRIEVGYAIQRTEIWDHSIKMARDTMEFFDAKHGRVNASRSCNSHHLTRSIDSSNVDAQLREMERILAGAAAEIKQLISTPKEWIQASPHGVPLQAANRGTGPQFVVPRCKAVEHNAGPMPVSHIHLYSPHLCQILGQIVAKWLTGEQRPTHHEVFLRQGEPEFERPFEKVVSQAPMQWSSR